LIQQNKQFCAYVLKVAFKRVFLKTNDKIFLQIVT